MPILYNPFSIKAAGEPEILTAAAFEEEAVPLMEIPSGEPADEVILEQNGIHYINSQVLHPDKDTRQTLDPHFLDLVESVIKPRNPETSGLISSKSAD